MQRKSKSKIHLVLYDADNWAFHRIAQGLEQHNPYFHACRNDLTTSIRTQNVQSILQLSWSEGATPEWNAAPPTIAYLAHHGATYSKYDSGLSARILITPNRNCEKAIPRLNKFHGIITSNSTLYAWAQTIHPAVRHVDAGVDVKIFHPSNETQQQNQPVRVGYPSRMPSARDQVLGWDVKGFLPIVSKLQPCAENSWSLHVLGRSPADAVSAAEMSDWYRSMDVILIPSLSEGIPMPLLEAMACGCIVLATPFSAACELIHHRHNGFLLPPWHDRVTADITPPSTGPPGNAVVVARSSHND